MLQPFMCGFIRRCGMRERITHPKACVRFYQNLMRPSIRIILRNSREGSQLDSYLSVPAQPRFSLHLCQLKSIGGQHLHGRAKYFFPSSPNLVNPIVAAPQSRMNTSPTLCAMRCHADFCVLAQPRARCGGIHVQLFTCQRTAARRCVPASPVITSNARARRRRFSRTLAIGRSRIDKDLRKRFRQNERANTVREKRRFRAMRDLRAKPSQGRPISTRLVGGGKLH